MVDEKENEDAGTETSVPSADREQAPETADEATASTDGNADDEEGTASTGIAPAGEGGNASEQADGKAADGTDGKEADVDAGGDEEQVARKRFDFRPLAAARRKASQGLPLTEYEQNVYQRYLRGVERMRQKLRPKNQRIANRIAEMQVFESVAVKDIAKAMGWKSPGMVQTFKHRYPDLMEIAYARLRKMVEDEQEARLISVDDRLSQKATAALGVFDDHLNGTKVGKLNPAVRQRAAEKVIEFMQKGRERSRVPGGFDPKALALIGERQRALRPRNDLTTTAEVVDSEETAPVR